MLNQSLLKTSLLMAGLSTLAACGSSASEPSGDNPLNARPTMMTSVDTDTDADTDAGDTEVENPDVAGSDLVNPVPQIATIECGAMPISETQFSNTASAPAIFTAGEIIEGRIDPDSAGNTDHYWNIELQPGFYHMVFDSSRVDNEDSDLGLQIVNLNDPGEEDDEILLQNDGLSIFRVRTSLFYEVNTADTLNLQVITEHDAEDYTFGIFENGSAVPSPVMDDCPSIQPLSLDSTESLTLPEYESDSDELWYQINLELGDFLLNSMATRVDGEEGVIYQFRSVDHFGETERYKDISSISETNVATFSGSGDLPVSEDGLVWVRVRSGADEEQTMEFTLSSDN